jgi:nucleotide-binding universal stress UspA family protein
MACILQGEFAMYKHILVPLDGSDLSRKAQAEATALACSVGAKMTVIHVVAPFHLHIQPWASSPQIHGRIEGEHLDEQKKSAQAMVDAAAEQVKTAGVECTGLAVVNEYPFRGIIETASERHCDLILMSSHGRRGLEGLLLGSETVKVLTHSTIPVLIVR